MKAHLNYQCCYFTLLNEPLSEPVHNNTKMDKIAHTKNT